MMLYRRVVFGHRVFGDYHQTTDEVYRNQIQANESTIQHRRNNERKGKREESIRSTRNESAEIQLHGFKNLKRSYEN